MSYNQEKVLHLIQIRRFAWIQPPTLLKVPQARLWLIFWLPTPNTPHPPYNFDWFTATPPAIMFPLIPLLCYNFYAFTIIVHMRGKNMFLCPVQGFIWWEMKLSLVVVFFYILFGPGPLSATQFMLKQVWLRPDSIFRKIRHPIFLLFL